jgi:glycosyltransferase involved in cell wall biosynthesis
VVTVSEFSKAEISHTYDINPNDITVVYNAADNQFSETAIDRRARTFLALAAGGEQKNHICILKAFHLLAQSRTVHLRIMGAAPQFEDHPLLQVPGQSTITQLGRVTDAELVDEYRRASAFIFPPLYAGFGLPPIEAQACGCPVIASTAGALQEVLRDSAIYFDPRSGQQLRDAMERILDEPRLRADLRERGQANVGRFSWTESAQRIKTLIDDLRDETVKR